MRKLLCIVGPTGIGKTELAIKLNHLFPSVLISADSRQVYRGMDIVTGKDQPKGVTLHGIDFVNPDQDCSVSLWQKEIYSVLNGSLLPIVVGGTGLYVKSLIEPIDTINLKPNQELRDRLSKLSVKELQGKLKLLNLKKFDAMNNSDINNPRRLIRAIEISLNQNAGSRQNWITYNYLIIGLQNYDYLNNSRIRDRVVKRLALGAIEETKKLLVKYSPNLPSMSAIGYKHIISFLKGRLSKEQLIDNWTKDELSYAKRQMVWFKKMPNINWFNLAENNHLSRVEELVKTWYYQS